MLATGAEIARLSFCDINKNQLSTREANITQAAFRAVTDFCHIIGT